MFVFASEGKEELHGILTVIGAEQLFESTQNFICLLSTQEPLSTQCQLKIQAVFGCAVMEGIAQTPQSAGQEEQISDPLQLPSPHEGVSVGFVHD